MSEEEIIQPQEVKSTSPEIIQLGLPELLVADGKKEVGLTRNEEKYTISAIEIPFTEKPGQYYLVLGMWDANTNQAVGHIDLQVDPQGKRGYLITSTLGFLNEEEIAGLPPKYQQLIKDFEPKPVGPLQITLDDQIVNAMEIQQPYQGKKLGTTIFALGKALMGLRGIEEIQIEDDQTLRKGGFYKRHGAVPKAVTHEEKGQQKQKVVQIVNTDLIDYEKEILRTFDKTSTPAANENQK